MKEYGFVFLLSMAPVFELRGAIPVGVALGLEPIPLLLVCILGNLLPVPLIILFIRTVMGWMKRWGGFFARTVGWIERKAGKAAGMFYRYELLGLFILVAIPLPGTGAWTGALVAAMLNLRMKTALPAIAAGVCVAGVIVLLLSCGVSSVLV